MRLRSKATGKIITIPDPKTAAEYLRGNWEIFDDGKQDTSLSPDDVAQITK